MAHFVKFGNLGHAAYDAEGRFVIRPNQDGRSVYVNADLVTTVYEAEGGAAICFNGNDDDEALLFVAAPVEAVVDKLTRCGI